ncbi:MAG: bile acid:sodium symporter family protein [Chromatiales bacterium]|nr:bile acid:sodium symporter family protein [Chromatiales bacterium]
MATITRLFPVWAVLASLAAWYWPASLVGLKDLIVPLLGVVMFGMGATLTASDFANVARRPRLVAIGTVLQFALMPFAAWLISMALDLDPMLAAGLVLVGACPGGTASNVVCYLARGDVALSITLTTVSTLLAVIATPLLTWLYIGTRVEVPAIEMLWSIARIVLVPVFAGIIVNHFFAARIAKAKSVFPLVSILAIVLIIAIIVALNSERLGTLLGPVLLAVVLHNAIGLAGGYYGARLFGYGGVEARTLAIEVGMQNSGLGVALASKFFAPAAALPGALFSIWHNLSGAWLAARWSARGRTIGTATRRIQGVV